MDKWPSETMYSEKYCDAAYEFRHVILSKSAFECIPKNRTLSDEEWRQVCRMSKGWENYAIHLPEPHILLFRRPIGTHPDTGLVDEELAQIARTKYETDIRKFC